MIITCFPVVKCWGNSPAQDKISRQLYSVAESHTPPLCGLTICTIIITAGLIEEKLKQPICTEDIAEETKKVVQYIQS